LFAVVEQAQRRGADGERARREPGQQAEPALLAAAIFGVRVGLFLVVFILGRFCFREKTVSSETTVAAASIRGQRSNHFLLPFPIKSPSTSISYQLKTALLRR